MRHTLVLPFLAAMAACAGAEVPQLINYQGRLLDGTNLVSGSVGLSLRLFSAPGGGMPQYEDSNAVTVVDGLYSTFIGDQTNSGNFANALTNAQVWVEVAVNGLGLAPRERLASVGYALVAGGVATGAVAAAGVDAPSFSNTFWKLGGNAVSNMGTAFIGTTDVAPLEFRQLNVRVLSITSATNSPNFCVGPAGNTIVNQSKGCSILGGSNNTMAAGVYYSTIGGGLGNLVTAGALGSAIVGGAGNFLSNSQGSVISGGITNSIGIYSDFSLIAGGAGNHIGGTGRCVSIVGGWGNIAEADSDFSTIVGGQSNSVGFQTHFALVAGRQAQANHSGTFVWADDHAADFGSATSNQFLIRAAGGVGINTTNPVAGGLTVAGDLVVTGTLSAAVLSGSGAGLAAGTVSNAALAGNAVTSDRILDGSVSGADIADGTISTNDLNFASVDGRYVNEAGDVMTGSLTTPQNITARRYYNSLNNVDGTDTIALGGSNNTIGAFGDYSVIGGGESNTVVLNADHSFIGGGRGNVIGNNANFGVIGGGADNVMVGFGNYSVISGGRGNIMGSNAWYCAIPGGIDNYIKSNISYAVAAGRRAKANHEGVFVWADPQNADYGSTSNNQFLIRASGGVGINATNPLVDFRVDGSALFGTNVATMANTTNVLNLMAGWTSNGAVNGISFYEDSIGNHMSIGYDGIGVGTANKLVVYGQTNQPLFIFENGGNLGIGVNNPTNLIHVVGGAQCNGSAWLNSSDRNLKENFQPVDPALVLEKVEALPISEWNYTRDGAAKRHVGPTAQDFYSTFGLGDNDTTISTIDPSGVALAAIKALARQNAELKAQVEALKARLEALESR